jgi:hypothetical protein
MTYREDGAVFCVLFYFEFIQFVGVKSGVVDHATNYAISVRLCVSKQMVKTDGIKLADEETESKCRMRGQADETINLEISQTFDVLTENWCEHQPQRIMEN